MTVSKNYAIHIAVADKTGNLLQESITEAGVVKVGMPLEVEFRNDYKDLPIGNVDED